MDFDQLVASRPQDLLLADEGIRNAAMQGLKKALDPIASKYSVLDAVHVDGLDAEQAFVQAQMVVDGTLDKLFAKLSSMVGDVGSEDEELEDEDLEGEELEGSELEGSDQDSEEGFEEGFEGFEGSEENQNQDPEEDLDEDSEGELDINGVDDFDETEYLDAEETLKSRHLEDEDEEDLDQDQEDQEDDDEEEEEEEEEEDDENKTEIEKLNKGMFRLEDFQQQVLAMEDENDDDDEEEINYLADLGEDSEEDVHYRDFFAPPPKKSRKIALAPAEQEEKEQEEQVEDAMQNARRDLFASDDEEDAEQLEILDDAPAGGSEKLSKFERQQRELEKQIAELEEENVGRKEWALRGEVASTERPQDSLISTELDFDRNAKAAPVITSEVTTSLEDMIRDRIKKSQFDDLARRLPPSELDHKKSKQLDEVSETKSSKSLAELYEDDKLRKENSEYFAQQDDAKQVAAHKEITDLYATLSRKLDALCSWNYTPKAPKPSIQIVTDAPAISMEDAQPSTMATGSSLAPQEVYKPGQNGAKDEIVGADGLPVARGELTPDERRRQRRRAKARSKAEAARKPAPVEEPAAATAAGKNGKGKPTSKNAMFETLKKGNVTMVDKRGNKRDMRGNVVKDAKPTVASHVKL